MADIENIGAQPFEEIDGLRPRFQVKVGRRRWRAHVIHAGQAHPGSVTCEKFAGMRIEEYDMVDGMTGRVVDFEAAARYVEPVAVLDDMQAIRGGRFDLAP